MNWGFVAIACLISWIEDRCFKAFLSLTWSSLSAETSRRVRPAESHDDPSYAHIAACTEAFQRWNIGALSQRRCCWHFSCTQNAPKYFQRWHAGVTSGKWMIPSCRKQRTPLCSTVTINACLVSTRVCIRCRYQRIFLRAELYYAVSAMYDMFHGDTHCCEGLWGIRRSLSCASWWKCFAVQDFGLLEQGVLLVLMIYIAVKSCTV